ncbi:MAG: hypothetical protein PHX10_13165, partial [Gallionellaceae bacterium]|nr:hypothetical protein [Gallionellaceae bacterium]
MSRTLAALLVLLASVQCAAAGEPPQEQDAWFALLPGHFVLVGRLPDNGAAYFGKAVISAQGHGFTLSRTIGARTITATGTIEVPSPPGEGRILRFRWQDPGPRLMSCQVQGDLDNYARLSCLWVIEGHKHKAPGLESY